MVGDDLAGGGQLEARRDPLEQRQADFCLQAEDLPVDGGGGDVQPPRGLADRPGAPDGIEVMQGGGVDAQRLLSHGVFPLPVRHQLARKSVLARAA